MPAVHQHRELYAARAAAGEHGLYRGARRAPGVQHVVRQHHVLRRHVEVELRPAHKGAFRDGRQIVPVKADVYTAAGNCHALYLLYVLLYHAGDRLTPAADADKHDVVHALVFLGDLVGDPHQRAAQRGLVHYLCFQLHGGSPFPYTAAHIRRAGQQKMPCLPARHNMTQSAPIRPPCIL